MNSFRCVIICIKHTQAHTSSYNKMSHLQKKTLNQDSKSSGFGHIYFDDWRIGAICHRMVEGEIEILGKVVAKELCGAPQDPDIRITFERDGKKYQHVMDFDRSYKLF